MEWECLYIWYCACEKRDGNACKSLKGHLWLHRGGSVDVIAGPCYLGRRHWSCLWWIQLKIWNKKSQFAFQTGLYINRVQGPFHPLPLCSQCDGAVKSFVMWRFWTIHMHGIYAVVVGEGIWAREQKNLIWFIGISGFYETYQF